MTKADFEERTGRPAPTDAERRLAAEIRVRADKRRKAQTPKWIQKLANVA